MALLDFLPEGDQAHSSTALYDVPEYVTVLFGKVIEYMFTLVGDFDPGPMIAAYPEMQVAGIQYRPYQFSCRDDHNDQLPHFEYNDLKIWYYKWWGRGMVTNVEFTAQEWVDLYQLLMDRIDEYKENTDAIC